MVNITDCLDDAASVTTKEEGSSRVDVGTGGYCGLEDVVAVASHGVAVFRARDCLRGLLHQHLELAASPQRNVSHVTRSRIEAYLNHAEKTANMHAEKVEIGSHNTTYTLGTSSLSCRSRFSGKMVNKSQQGEKRRVECGKWAWKLLSNSSYLSENQVRTSISWSTSQWCYFGRVSR